MRAIATSVKEGRRDELGIFFYGPFFGTAATAAAAAIIIMSLAHWQLQERPGQPHRLIFISKHNIAFR